MEITIQINGQALPVEVSIEVYTYLDQAARKDENLAHEQRRHWDMRELDEYIIAQECSRSYILTPEQIVLTLRPFNEDGTWGAKCRKEYDLDRQGQRIRLPSGAFKSHRVNTTDWNDRDKAEQWRSAWSDYVNRPCT